MIVSETPAAPMRPQADTQADTERLHPATRIAVWAALAGVGGLFWLGVWKLAELLF